MTSTIDYDNHRYSALKPRHWSYALLLLSVCCFTVVGWYAAYSMEHAGHHITGMNNHIVWGLPHVFAISLIVAASGALNGASLSSVFGNTVFKPYARLSIALALSLLMGGLMVLVLDLGRPDRLIVAMTHYNFRSIFAWNIFLYTGFIVIGVLYLWMLMERRMNRHIRTVGSLALFWRIVLTTATGSIFGFLVGRNSLDSAIIAPLFIALSLVMGTAVFSLAIITIASWQDRKLDTALTQSLEKLMQWFLLAVLYFSVVHHLTNLYAREHQSTEQFTLTGDLSLVFWLGHIAVGIAIPLLLIVLKIVASPRARLFWVGLLSIAGGGALVYVVVIGSQSTPQRLFPGHTVISSRFGDAGFEAYRASAWEWALGLGGVSVAAVICILLLRALPFTPSFSSNRGE